MGWTVPLQLLTAMECIFISSSANGEDGRFVGTVSHEGTWRREEMETVMDDAQRSAKATSRKNFPPIEVEPGIDQNFGWFSYHIGNGKLYRLAGGRKKCKIWTILLLFPSAKWSLKKWQSFSTRNMKNSLNITFVCLLLHKCLSNEWTNNRRKVY